MRGGVRSEALQVCSDVNGEGHNVGKRGVHALLLLGARGQQSRRRRGPAHTDANASFPAPFPQGGIHAATPTVTSTVQVGSCKFGLSGRVRVMVREKS